MFVWLRTRRRSPGSHPFSQYLLPTCGPGTEGTRGSKTLPPPFIPQVAEPSAIAEPLPHLLKNPGFVFQASVLLLETSIRLYHISYALQSAPLLVAPSSDSCKETDTVKLNFPTASPTPAHQCKLHFQLLVHPLY